MFTSSALARLSNAIAVAAAHGADRPAARHTPGGGNSFSCGAVRRGGRVAMPNQIALTVAAFNAANPIGTAGHVLRDNGQVVPTKVEAAAIVFAGHLAVARFEGMRGFYSIDRFVRGEE